MRKGYPEEMKTTVKRLREQGFSYAAIADHVNVSVGTVIKWLKGANLPKATKAVVKAPAPPKPTKKNSSEATCCRAPSPAHVNKTVKNDMAKFYQDLLDVVDKELKKLNDLKTRLLKLAEKVVQAAEKIN